MFPYPSAEGLHVGNIYAFTGADIHGRFPAAARQRRLRAHRLRRLRHPLGELRPEARDTSDGSDPGQRGQLHPPAASHRGDVRLGSLGGYNLPRLLPLDPVDLPEASSKPGWAERKKAPVNWCPSCKTVLANEQVDDGLCERCESTVEQRVIAQWFFRISDYSQRLLDNLSRIDWSDSTRKAQANWIGRSEGARLVFPVVGSDDVIDVFTTRPDTLFGATYMVLAPEHPLVESLTPATHRDRVNAYVRKVAAHGRWSAARRSAGRRRACSPAGFCVNPATGAEIPVWVADLRARGVRHGGDHGRARARRARLRRSRWSSGFPWCAWWRGPGTMPTPRWRRPIPTTPPAGWSTPGGFDGPERPGGQGRHHRRPGGAGGWAKSRSTTTCATGASRASAIGVPPSPSCTAPNAARSRSRRATCRSSCPASRTSSPTTTA